LGASHAEACGAYQILSNKNINYMKTLGIIGGLGPQTTAKVYLSVVDLVRKSGHDKYPPIIIYNLSFPFILEKEAIIEGINSEKMLPYLINGAKVLEKAGASFGILPCNTLHKYIKEIRESVRIPFLSILEETLLKLQSLKVKEIGILATQTTVDSKIYSNILEKNKIKVMYPTEDEQVDINKIIVQLLNGKKNQLQDQKIKEVSVSLQKRGAEIILLACTDLQMAMPEGGNSIPIIDTTEVLIQASVRELIGK